MVVILVRVFVDQTLMGIFRILIAKHEAIEIRERQAVARRNRFGTQEFEHMKSHME